jgi:PTH2 family peptidyl-tRNA hydrolase
MIDIKQVILVRNDLDMSPGKACAQVGHASLLFLAERVNKAIATGEEINFNTSVLHWLLGARQQATVTSPVTYGGMKKIVLGVKNNREMYDLLWQAHDAKLEAYTVFDEGLESVTCVAIGPDHAVAIDRITGDLPLYGPKLELESVALDAAVYKAVKRARAEELAEKTFNNPYHSKYYYDYGRNR